jgi:hypothetical protein
VLEKPHVTLNPFRSCCCRRSGSTASRFRRFRRRHGAGIWPARRNRYRTSRTVGAIDVAVIRCATAAQRRARQGNRPSRVRLGLSNHRSLKEMDMSFVVAVFVLLLALFVGAALDDIGVRTPLKARSGGSSLDGW